MFTSSLNTNVQNLTDYILQRIGGHSYYSDRKGFPSLIHRHTHLELTEALAERWLGHFADALGAMGVEGGVVVDDAHKTILLNHLRYTAYYMVAASNVQKEMASNGSMD